MDRVSRRTSPRTYIGYLVSYEGSNIYRIWVPSKATVIRTRDVNFNEDEFFNPETEQRLEDPLDSFHFKTRGPEPLLEDTDSDIESTITVITPNAVPSQDNEDSTSHGQNEPNKADDGSIDTTPYLTPDSSRDLSPSDHAEESPRIVSDNAEESP